MNGPRVRLSARTYRLSGRRPFNMFDAVPLLPFHSLLFGPHDLLCLIFKLQASSLWGRLVIFDAPQKSFLFFEYFN